MLTNPSFYVFGDAFGGKGLKVKTGHKVFRILFTCFLREFETIANCKIIFCDGFNERN